MRSPGLLLILAAVGLLVACAVPCTPLPHGREPLGGIWYFKAGDEPAWASPELDETDVANGWRVVDVPGGLKDYAPREATAGWLRVRFALPPEHIEGEHAFLLGVMDTSHEVFLNGARLEGPSGGLVAKALADATTCLVPVPLGVLRDVNVLAVRVTGWREAGGMIGGIVAILPRAEAEAWVKRPNVPLPVLPFETPYARIQYDPNRRRLTAFAAREKTLLDDAHFILRTRVREYDLSRIPEAEIETLPRGAGVRTLHVLHGEGIRFEAFYFLPKELDWPALVVMGEASGGGEVQDIDLVYHAASPGIVGAGSRRELGARRVAWGRLFIYAPQKEIENLPDSVKKYYRSEGAFELFEAQVVITRPDP
jgi:hypothetical protein